MHAPQVILYVLTINRDTCRLSVNDDVDNIEPIRETRESSQRLEIRNSYHNIHK
jgi:hypothetical protein